MKMYYIITDAQRGLENTYFIPTLTKHTKKFELNPIYYKPKNENIGNFAEEDYTDILLFRNKTIIDLIEQNYGDIIVFTDVDIVVFKDFYSIISQLIPKHDILHTAEVPNQKAINGGFTVINCNKKTKKFYETILKKTLAKNDPEYLDQHAMTEYYMVDKNPLKLQYKVLPPQLFCIRHHWEFLQKNKPFLVFFHATHTIPNNGRSSLKLKEMYLHGCMEWMQDKIERFY